MTYESFHTKFLFAPVTVTIDPERNGKIISIVHKSTNWHVDMSPEMLSDFEDKTAETRRMIVAECIRQDGDEADWKHDRMEWRQGR